MYVFSAQRTRAGPTRISPIS